MRIENADLLASFGGRRQCEVCGRVRQCDAAHIFSKGSGRVDEPWNLVSLCREDHAANHQRTNGRDVTRTQLLEIAAMREGVSPEWIIAEVRRIRAMPQPRDGEREKPITKRKKKEKAAWQLKAEAMTKAWRKAYRERLKEQKKQREQAR